MGTLSKGFGKHSGNFCCKRFLQNKKKPLFSFGIFHSFLPRLADCGAIAMPFMMAQFLRDR